MWPKIREHQVRYVWRSKDKASSIGPSEHTYGQLQVQYIKKVNTLLGTPKLEFYKKLRSLFLFAIESGYLSRYND
jgi:hypothetical protein